MVGTVITCSLMRFRRDPVPTLIILLANSTPMVCDDRTLHSFLTKRCRRHDLRAKYSVSLGSSCGRRVRDVAWRYKTVNLLSRSTRAQQYDLGQVIIHAPQLLGQCQRAYITAAGKSVACLPAPGRSLSSLRSQPTTGVVSSLRRSGVADGSCSRARIMLHVRVASRRSEGRDFERCVGNNADEQGDGGGIE